MSTVPTDRTDPTVPMMPRGAFLLSLDTELAWGGVHSGAFLNRRDMFARTRGAVTRLLDLAARYEIRATWAVVAHLMLNRCAPVEGVKHPEIVRPCYTWKSGDWFEHDPCTDSARDPFWYAPDMIEQVRACSGQEIGCHGFSHIIAGDPGCGAECFRSELRASRTIAARWGLDLRSFVFPRNAIGHLDVLAAEGFTAYRGEITPAWQAALFPPIEKIVLGLRWSTPMRPLTAQPSRCAGLWNFPATSYYLHRDGLARRIPIELRVRRALSGIRTAAVERSLFHLYFHPFNLATDPEGLLSGLERIFRAVADARDRERLDNPTMGELAGRLARMAPSAT